MKRRFFLTAGLASLAACKRGPKPALVTARFEILGKVADVHDGRPLDLFDVRVTLTNPTHSPLYLEQLKTNYLSDYLKLRNPEKVCHIVQRRLKDDWTGTGQGYTGFPMQRRLLPAGGQFQFVCTIAWRLIKTPDTFRIMIRHYESSDGGRPCELFSPEFSIEA